MISRSWIARVMPAALAGLALLSGCASTRDVSPVDWQHGARRATVLSVYAADETPAELPACLAALPPAEYAAHRYVKVRYRHVRSMHSAVAELSPDLPLHVGDKVELWPADCSAGKLSRISQVLSTHSAASYASQADDQ